MNAQEYIIRNVQELYKESYKLQGWLRDVKGDFNKCSGIVYSCKIKNSTKITILENWIKA